jgi:HK97 family phage major capsid protein
MLDTIEEYRRIVATMERRERISSELETPPAPETKPRPKPQRVAGGEERDKFPTFGAQMAAVMRAGLPGGTVDPRLNITAAASGLSETVPSDGGFLVQQDFSSELLQQVIETGILSSRCRRQLITGASNSIKINGVDETSRAASRYGGIVAYWADEAAEKTKSKPKFRKIELSLKKLIGLCYATDELLDDAPALEGFIREAFPGEFGFQLDEGIVNGVGAGTLLGFMNSGSLVTVNKETGQAAATVVAENIDNMYARRFAGQTQNYIWVYNQMIEPQLSKMAYAVGTGGIPVYIGPGGLKDSPYGTLKGLPAIPIEQASALGTAGDISLVNLANGYILAEKGGIKSDMSIHVRFIYDESVFRFVLRVDGQPVRASALTPYKGGSGATQSHFITLATRS